MKNKSTRGKVNVSCAILFVGATALSCGSGSSVHPVPSLAVSLEAQASFQPIRERWLLSTKEERASLAPRLEAFGQRFRSDPLARVADAYLAFIALDRGEPARARAIARAVREGPIGNTRDLGSLIDGASLAREGKPEEALRLLDPLVGRMIDSFAQDLLHEAVVEAAVDAHRWYQAIVYMNEWLRGTDEQDMSAVKNKVGKLLEQFPPASLESALRAMGASKQGDIWERELRAALASRLAAVAVERSDPNLARSVLETSRTVVGMGDAGTSLAQLATSGGRAPRIIGARVGLLIETDRPSRTARSAEVLAGALEVFRPDRGMDLLSGNPGPEPPVLITRDVTREGSVADAVNDLAYLGVSIVVGGYDPERSAELAAYAEAESIPVILLVAPKRTPKGARFTFVAGLAEPSWSTEVGDPSRTARVARGKAPEHPLAASCDGRSAQAGETKFPVAAWRKAGVDAVAIDGPGWCARDVLVDLKATGFAPTVFLGLEARGAAEGYQGKLRVASCGLLDAVPPPAELKAWLAGTGLPPTWFEALGRDASQLAHDAAAPLPRHTFVRMDEVMEARGVVQQGLLRVDAALWTTTSRGFGGKRALAREVRYVER